MSRTKTPTQCPNCHHPEAVREILWGMPSFDEDLDKYWIGGRCLHMPELRHLAGYSPLE